MTSAQKAWKRVSEIFDGPDCIANSSGLCWAPKNIDIAVFDALRPGVIYRFKAFSSCPGYGYSGRYILPTNRESRPIRATIAALFAAMTDEEREEVL